MMGKSSKQTEDEYWADSQRPIPGYKEYSEWKISRNSYQPPHEWDRSHFHWFENSPPLLERVIALPFETQSAFLENRLAWIESSTMMTLLDLLEETNSDYLKVKNWKAYRRSSVPVDADAPVISHEFEDEFARFLKFQKSFGGIRPANKRALDSTIILLLVKKHGEKTVLEVMRSWTDNNQVTNHVADLKLVVENWHGLSHIPISWTFSSLGVESWRKRFREWL